jgi:cytoskeleton protein RodZ
VQAPGIEVGERVLRVEAPGFKPYQTTLRLTENKNLSVALEVAPPPPAASNPSTTPANPQTTPPATTPPTNTQGVVLRLEGRSWVRVTTASGQKLYEGIPAQGTVLTYNQPVVVRAGNPAAVRVTVGGQDQGAMGQPGQPLTRRYPASP